MTLSKEPNPPKECKSGSFPSGINKVCSLKDLIQNFSTTLGLDYRIQINVDVNHVLKNQVGDLISTSSSACLSHN